MSDVKFIIGLKNSEPAPPEFEYFCGPKSPIRTLSACISEDETIWDTNPDCAEVYRSTPDVAVALGHLTNLFGEDGLCIKKRIVSYELMNTKLFLELVQKNKVKDILKGLDEDDIKYLQDNGVLDLTIVT